MLKEKLFTNNKMSNHHSNNNNNNNNINNNSKASPSNCFNHFDSQQFSNNNNTKPKIISSRVSSQMNKNHETNQLISQDNNISNNSSNNMNNMLINKQTSSSSLIISCKTKSFNSGSLMSAAVAHQTTSSAKVPSQQSQPPVPIKCESPLIKKSNNNLTQTTSATSATTATTPTTNKNLTNLRDVLRATHQTENQIDSVSKSRKAIAAGAAAASMGSKCLIDQIQVCCKSINHHHHHHHQDHNNTNKQHSNQTSLNDILKLAENAEFISSSSTSTSNSNNNNLNNNNNNTRKLDNNSNMIYGPQSIISKIEEDLQESLKLLKQYNTNENDFINLAENFEDCASNNNNNNNNSNNDNNRIDNNLDENKRMSNISSNGSIGSNYNNNNGCLIQHSSNNKLDKKNLQLLNEINSSKSNKYFRINDNEKEVNSSNNCNNNNNNNDISSKTNDAEENNTNNKRRCCLMPIEKNKEEFHLENFTNSSFSYENNLTLNRKNTSIPSPSASSSSTATAAGGASSSVSSAAQLIKTNENILKLSTNNNNLMNSKVYFKNSNDSSSICQDIQQQQQQQQTDATNCTSIILNNKNSKKSFFIDFKDGNELLIPKQQLVADSNNSSASQMDDIINEDLKEFEQTPLSCSSSVSTSSSSILLEKTNSNFNEQISSQNIYNNSNNSNNLNDESLMNQINDHQHNHPYHQDENDEILLGANLNNTKKKSKLNVESTNLKLKPIELNDLVGQKSLSSCSASSTECPESSRLPSSTTYWNYDELNELRIKFISLLSSNKLEETNSNEDNQNKMNRNQNGFNINEKLSSSSARNMELESSNDFFDKKSMKLSSMNFVSPVLQPISPAEQLKIESFYRSFGTSLYIASTCACLYTMTNVNNKPESPCTEPTTNTMKSSHSNRSSSANTFSNNNLSSNNNNNQKSNEIDQEILKDFMNNKYQNHVSVYHRGVPLWLFNSGTNPRRPSRQLKFTLAEKGTGFILWQDRIDSNSDLKIYSLRKSDNKIINYASFCEKAESNPRLNKIEQANELFSSMLVTFRASDRKTTVFVKFDINSETAKFYDQYLQLTKKINQEIKQRTKSLPVGVGTQINNKSSNLSASSFHANNGNNNNNNVVRRGKSNASNSNFISFENNNSRNTTDQFFQNGNSKNNSNYKRQSYYGNTVKYKRISKSDISSPCDLKHIINLSSNDRDSYYTLSKLLPVTVCSSPLSSSSLSPFSHNSVSSSSSASSSSSSSCTNKSTPSPTNSIASSFSSSSASPENVSNFIINNTSLTTTNNINNNNNNNNNHNHHTAENRYSFGKNSTQIVSSSISQSQIASSNQTNSSYSSLSISPPIPAIKSYQNRLLVSDKNHNINTRQVKNFDLNQNLLLSNKKSVK